MKPSSDHRPHKKPGPSAPTSRDWTTLPHDILFAVCLKLELREILRGADRVCKGWRHVTVGEPALWRHLDMGTMHLSQCRDLVSRGGVTCEFFTARCDSDVSLRFLVRGHPAPCLKSLRLLDANVSFEALNESVQKLAQLEELDVELPYCGYKWYKKLIQCICEARPQLRRLSVTVGLPVQLYPKNPDREKFVIPVMCELRSFELTQCNFTVDELVATIDNCPLLESLQIGGLDRDMLRQLRERCEAKNLTITS
ncbi:hypothetical protein HU200_056137 [Digitaria exilis]|uniref:F-box domain-containing protein n=1 Tax=Digitaria exilis TaxID=1010633 RepID=A0A835AMS9_9POAL|nr:hypothetical protein HU200_056137 [Digitaria exilis]CAB3480294.1 unnamed protein product [Digitaria exilis]